MDKNTFFFFIEPLPYLTLYYCTLHTTLDRLAFAEMERINQREKSASAKMYLNIEFPQTQDTGLPIAVVRVPLLLLPC